MKVTGVAFIERDDRVEVPVFHAEAVEGQRIMGFVQGHGGEVKAEQVNGLMGGGEIGDRVVTMVVEDVDDERQLAVVLE